MAHSGRLSPRYSCRHCPDQDGYLWIGTEAGLFRFDGVRFVAWIPPKGQQLPDFQILSLLSASDGSLWIGTAKGLARWKDGELTVYKDLPNRTNAIVEDHQGNIWIARSQMAQKRAPLCRLRGTDVHCFGLEEGDLCPPLRDSFSTTPAISGFQGMRDSANGKMVFPQHNFQKELEQQGSLIGVFTLAVENENHAWIGIQRPDGHLELHEFDHGRWQSHRLPKAQGPPPSASALFIDRQDALWIGTGSDGIYRLSGDAPRDLDPILRDEVYRMAGEAMRNAFRHAHSRRIEVEIHYDLRRLRLRVRDDGRGIDSKIVSDKGRPGHYGIRGMGERAKAIGGNLELWSNLDSGTEIELSIPANAAYSTSPAQRRS